MANQITHRIYDFLRTIPPFTYVRDKEALLRVAERVEIVYLPANSVIYRPGDAPNDRFYVVREGAVELWRVSEGAEQLIERCGEGDSFGIRPLLAKDQHLFLSRTAEETLLYGINTEGFEELIGRHPGLLQYLAASMAGSNRYSIAAGSEGDPETLSRVTHRPAPEFGAERQVPGKGASSRVPVVTSLLESQRIEHGRPPVTCTAAARVIDAARVMTEHNVGSIVVVDHGGRPTGIITDRDLRRKVATGIKGLEEKVAAIMSRPVICVDRRVTAADAQIQMVRHGINHLVQTEDGTDRTAVTGVVSKHDLLVIQGNNPAVLIREIGRAKSADYLATLRRRAEKMLGAYLEQEVNIVFILTVMTQLNDEIIRKCIKLGLARMQADGRGNPPALFDWLTLGSQGRGEQLLRTDQDNALIFEDVPPARYNAVKDYFLQLGGYVNDYLNQVGFSYCPADMMAGNPEWCLPVSKWRDQFTAWMTDSSAESILNISIFFDYRGVWGDGSLPAKLSAHVAEELRQGRRRFLATLAQFALDNPSPLTFFRNFVVERGGDHKDQFDLKSRAMRPLTDAARALLLEQRKGTGTQGTIGRFETLAELDHSNAELYREAAEAYEMYIRLRTTKGLTKGDSGRYLTPADLSRTERLLLRNSFDVVKRIQNLLELRFQLSFLR